MKWIGQHIWDFISRFRSDVYLEAVETGTIVSGGNLGLDSNNKVVKVTGVSSSLAAYVASTVTVTDSTASTAFPVVFHDESNGLLDDTGTFTYKPSTSALSIESSISSGGINLVNNADDANDHHINFMNLKGGAAGDDIDDLGTIQFYGRDDGTASLIYGSFKAYIIDASNTDEAGGMSLQVATEGTQRQVLTGTGDGASSKVDVSIGYGSESVTTVAGNLTTDGRDIIHQSSSVGDPKVYIKSTASGNKPCSLNFTKDKGVAGADGDGIGQIVFWGDNDAQEQVKFADMTGVVRLAADGVEEGRFSIGIKNTSHVVLPMDSFSLVSNGTATDANIGYLASSTTTIAGSLDVTSGADINNPADGGTSALIVDNDDTDQIALDINASNITQHIIDVDGSALTSHYGMNMRLADITDTGGGVKVAWVDDQVTDMNRVGGASGMIHLDYNKEGNVGSGQRVSSTGMYLDMSDTASNNVGEMAMYGMNFTLGSASNNGTALNYGIKGVVTGGDTNRGLWLQCTDGAGEDIRLDSSTSANDFFSIAVGAHGQTTLKAYDSSGTDADMLIQASGDATIHGLGSINLNADGGTINFVDDLATLARIDANGLSFENNLNAHIIFDGSTNDAHMTSLGVIDPTGSNTIRLPDSPGTVQLEGTRAGKQLQTFSCNFYDNIATTTHYLPFKDINEQTYAYQDEVAMLAPCDGRVVSVTLRPHSLLNSVDTTLTVQVNTKAPNSNIYASWTAGESEALTAAATDDHHVFHFAFSNAKHFESTESFNISVNSSVSPAGNGFWYAVVVVEWDWTTFLGDSSAEFDAAP